VAEKEEQNGGTQEQFPPADSNTPSASSEELPAENPEHGENPVNHTESHSKQKKSSFLKRWVFICLAGLILIGAASPVIQKPLKDLGGYYGFLFPKKNQRGAGASEKRLKPFFVPLPEGSSNLAARMVMSVKWDPMTAARFKQHSTQIRAELYEYLLEFAKKGKDFTGELDSLESELGRVFRRALGVTDVVVVLEDVAYM
jgi:hypothetical protein